MPTVPELTEKILRQAPLTTRTRGSQYYILENGTGRRSLRGFGVRIARTTKTFVLRFRERPYTLATYPETSIADARSQAIAKKTEILFGPAAVPAGAPARRPAPQHLVRDLHARYFSVRVEPDCKPRTVEEYSRAWRLHLLPRFGKMPLSELTTELVEDMKLSMADQPVAFNRALQQIQAACNYAVELEWMQRNPASACRTFVEKPRLRRASPQEYLRLGAALVGAESSGVISAPSLALIWGVVLTGCRPFEIRDARLEWCTLEGRTPRIVWPPGTAKGDRRGQARGRVVWLPRQLADRLAVLRRPARCEWLIPGRVPGQPLKDVSKAWARVLQLAGITNLTLRDLRTSYRSEGPAAGIPGEHMRDLLGHAPGSPMTDTAYLAIEAREGRGASEQMAAHIQGKLGLGK